MTDIAYQNKDITAKYFGENLKEKSFSAYGLEIPKIRKVLPTNLPAVEANELRIDNLFLLEDGSLAIVDYESDYTESNKVKYLNYLTRTIKHYIQEGLIPATSEIHLRMIVIYTADILPGQTRPDFDAGCLKLHIEEAFLVSVPSEDLEHHLQDKIIKGLPLTEEEQMQFIILPLTYKGKGAKRDSIRRCFQLAKRIENETIQTFLLSGMLVFSDKIISSEESRDIKRWIMMTKVGQLFEEEKLAYAKEESERTKKEMAVKMLQKGYPVREIADIIQGLSLDEILALGKNIKQQ